MPRRDSSAEHQPCPCSELLEWKHVKLLICLKDQNKCVSYSSSGDPAPGRNQSFCTFACFAEIHALRPNTLTPHPKPHPKPNLLLQADPARTNVLTTHTDASLRQMAPPVLSKWVPPDSQACSSQNHLRGLLHIDFSALYPRVLIQ